MKIIQTIRELFICSKESRGKTRGKLKNNLNRVAITESSQGYKILYLTAVIVSQCIFLRFYLPFSEQTFSCFT